MIIQNLFYSCLIFYKHIINVKLSFANNPILQTYFQLHNNTLLINLINLGLRFNNFIDSFNINRNLLLILRKINEYEFIW